MLMNKKEIYEIVDKIATDKSKTRREIDTTIRLFLENLVKEALNEN